MSDKASFLKYINEVGGSDDESESSIQDVHPMTTTAQSTESGISYDSLSTAGHEHAIETKEEDDFASHEMMNKGSQQIQSKQDSNLKKSLEGNDLKNNQQQEDDQVMTTIAPSVTETSANNNQKQQQMLQSPPRTRIKSILHTPPATPSPSKSSLHKNNSTPSSIKRVRMSPLIKTTPTKRAMATPPRINKPSSNSSPESSKRPKIISPFSPRARKLRLKLSNNTPVTTSSLQWSMKPSRKVSILVNVMPHLQSHLYNDEETTLCLYPNIAPEEVIVEGDKMTFSPARSVKSSYSVTSTSSILNKATPAQEVLLVNPDIFGDIPTSITLETARMVQYFSNKSSEDWVRKFKFDEVCWPDVRQLIGIKKQNTNATMQDIASATVEDLSLGRDSVLFGYGIYKSGRVESMFGTVAGMSIDPLQTLEGRYSTGLELGLFGLIVENLLQKQSLDKKMEFQVTMVEVLEEDVVKDLLLDPQARRDAGRLMDKSIRIRHPDGNGAVIENATHVKITSLDDAKQLVKRAFKSKYNLRERQLVGGRGHIVATIHLFPEGEKVPKKNGKKDFNYPLLQLVDLACAETEQMEQDNVSGRSKVEYSRIQNKRVACIRKSMAGLGGILRHLIIAERQHLPKTTMYRSSTITKLIQRALSKPESRAVMISTVCPKKESYKRTLHTLTFMHRLLSKPSKTAESPFESKDFDGHSFSGSHMFSPGDHSVAHSVASTVASEAVRNEFAGVKGNRAFLKSLVTDPRQRLATFYSPKERAKAGYGTHGDVPMTEITTIQEIETEPQQTEVTTTPGGYASIGSSLGDSPNNANISNGHLSTLSDEITFEGHVESTYDDTFGLPEVHESEEEEEEEEKFENDSENQDEMAIDNEEQISNENGLQSLSQEESEESNGEEDSYPREESSDIMEDPDLIQEAESGSTPVPDESNNHRQDPVGISADDLPREYFQAPQQRRPYRHDIDDENLDEEDWSDEDDLSQSYVSTLTPYDTFTGGESEDNPDHNHHSSNSEESFPRDETDSDASFPRNPTNHSEDLFPQTGGDSEPPLMEESQAVDRHEYMQQFKQEADQEVSPNNDFGPTGGENYQSELSQMMSYLDEDDEENETFDLRDNDDEVEPQVRDPDTSYPTTMNLHQTPPRKSRESKDISRDLPGFGESEDEDDVSLLLSPEEKRPKSNLALDESQLHASRDDDLSFDSSHSGEVALQPEGYSENIKISRHIDMDRDSFLNRDYSDNSIPISESFVEEVANTSTNVANAAKVQSSSPSPRVETSMIEKVKTLVSHSEALRSYSPRGQHTPRKSLENYKALLEESLEHLEQDAHMTSVGALSIDSDDSSLQSIDNSEKEINTTFQSDRSNQASFAGPTSDDELISNFVSSKPISSRNQSTQEGGSTIDQEAILTDIEQLKESIRKLVESTNEADLITELSKANIDVTDSFGNKGEPIKHTIKELTSQTEALQTFITSTVDQLNTSRLSEREKQNEVLEANSKLEETLDEIQSLRTSNRSSIDQIKKDHLDALDAVREKQDPQSDQLEQQSTLRTQLQQKEAQVNDLESTISSLQRRIDELSEQVNATILEREREVAQQNEIKSKDNVRNSELNELKRLVNELSEKLSNEISRRNEVEDRLGSEKAISTNVASRLENELQTHRDLRKKIEILEEKLAEIDSVNAVVSAENNVIKKEYREKITKLEEEYLQRTEKEKAELENKVTLLQQHISKSETDKDALEDRLTLELNSEREKMTKIIHELQKKVDQQQGDLLHSQDTLRQEYIEKVKILEERLDVKEQEKDDLEDQMTEEIQSLKSLLESKQRAEGNIEDELHVLKTNFERKLEYAEKEKESLKREIDILKERVADERSESSKQSRSLNSKVGEMERNLTRKDDQIQQLEDRLKSTKRSFEETKRSLTRTSELFEEETRARSDLTKKIQDLQHELNQAAITKGQTESELMNEVKKLRRELQSNEKKSDSLETEIKKLHSEYNDLMKKSSREKSSQENEIQILQDRLKSESENGDIEKAALLDQIAELRRELAEEKHENDDINSTLLELRGDFENSQARFKSVEQSRLLLEDENSSLNERLQDEARRFKRQKIELETKIQEYETKSDNFTSQIDQLNENLAFTRQDLESTKSTLADEKSNNISLQDMITALQGQLSTMIEERDNVISSSDDKIKSLTEELSEKERLGIDFKSQVESLKSMLSTTEEEAATEKAKLHARNATLEEANAALEERLTSTSSECQDFKRDLEKSKSENKTLKEHLEAEVKKLTEDLTLRMQEKAEYEATTRNLESILEERSAERDQLEDALEKQQQDYVELQENFTSLQQDHLSQKEESSKQTHALREELEQQESAVVTLTENLQTTERELKTSNTYLANERDNVKSLQDEIASLKQQLAELTRKYDELKSTTSDQIDSLQKEVDTKTKMNDDLGSQLESLKSMLSTTEEEAATEKAKMNEVNAALEDANAALEEKLQDSDLKLSDTLQALGESKSENKTLKEHLEAEVRKLTEDLTLRMQEKAEYEATTRNLESILEERSAERDQLEDALEKQARECEKLRNEISQGEGKLKDIEEKYKDRINAFEKEVEELNSREGALESDLEDQKERFQEQLEELMQERDSEFEKSKLYIDSIDQLRKELSDENEELTESIQDLEATILSYEKKEAEYVKDKSHITQQNIDLQNNVTDLSSKLAKEIANVASINSLHEEEIERILEKHDLDKEELRREVDEAKDRLKELENTAHDEVVRHTTITADLESKISNLESEISKKKQMEDELREKLERNSSEMMSLHEQLAVMSEDQTEVIREHTERISTLTRTIREKEIEIITQKEDTSDLEETIEQLKIKLEEIIDSRNNIEQSSLAKISALEKDIAAKQSEMDGLKSKLSEQNNSIVSASTQFQNEVDKKKELQKKLYETESELSKVRDKNSSFETKMQILEEKLATSTVKIATFQSEKDRLLDDIDRFKQMKEAEKMSFEERSKSHEIEVQDLSEIINGMKEEIQSKESSIEDLEATISDLQRQMQDQESKSRILSDNINIKGEESNRYLTEISSLKKKLQREKGRGSSRVDHLQKSLDEEKDANRHRIETLERTFLEKDKLIKSLEKTLREKELLNSNLSQSLEHTRDTLNSKINELQEDSKTNDDIADQKFQELSQRVSDLSIVTETLKHEKTTLSEKLKEEKEYRERLHRKNKLLKVALTDNDKKVREEMKELEFTMNSTISRLESKRQKTLEIEKEQMSTLLNELEDENETYKIRVTQLESTIRRLERQSKVRSNMSSSGSVHSHSNTADVADLQKENERLKRRIARMEQRQPLGDNMSVGSGRSFREREGGYGRDEPYYYAELQSERARRIKAEEFAAAMAARAKAGMEKRNEEIMGLRMQVSTLENAKENYDNQRQLLLGTAPSVSRNKDQLHLLSQERDEAKEEANQYKAIAEKLNSQVIAMHGAIGNDIIENEEEEESY